MEHTLGKLSVKRKGSPSIKITSSLKKQKTLSITSGVLPSPQNKARYVKRPGRGKAKTKQAAKLLNFDDASGSFEEDLGGLVDVPINESKGVVAAQNQPYAPC